MRKSGFAFLRKIRICKTKFCKGKGSWGRKKAEPGVFDTLPVEPKGSKALQQVGRLFQSSAAGNDKAQEMVLPGARGTDRQGSLVEGYIGQGLFPCAQAIPLLLEHCHALFQNDKIRVALDLTEEWDKICDTQLITGVTVVRTEYAQEHPDVVAAFLKDYTASVDAANNDLDGTAALCEEQGVVAKAAIAKAALPNCNIVCVTGDEMQADVAGYLQVLYDADPASVGGAMPDDGFYWMGA